MDDTSQAWRPATEPGAVPPATLDGEFDDGQLDEAEFEPDDADLLPSEPGRSWNRWTVALVAAVLMVASFGAGAYAQRSTGDSGLAAGPAGGRTGATGTGRYGGQFPGGQFPGGQFPGGQLPGGGELPGDGGGSAGGQPGGAAGGGASAGATPVLIGRVVAVSGTTLTVRNFAGATVKVAVAPGATVSVVSSTPLSGLKPGATVSVTGTKAADGSVTATGVTARAAAK